LRSAGGRDPADEGAIVNEDLLRRQLVAQLEGGAAHTPIKETIRGIPPAFAGRRPDGVGPMPWQLLEHMRIAQWDILRFTIDSEHVSPPWPEAEMPPDGEAWTASVEAFLRDLDEVKRLATDPATDLSARIEWGTGQTVLREILLVADHNAYYLGQL
jgi:hypothetical protein